MRNHSKRIEALENQTGAVRQERIKVWPDQIEAKIDRVFSGLDHEDFTIGLWGQVFDNDGKPFDEERSKKEQL